MKNKENQKNKKIILECEDLVKIYSNGPVSITALRGINFKFERGKIYVIYGPSGSGKTTFLGILGGLKIPSSGIVKLNNSFKIDCYSTDLFNYRKNNISTIFQEPIYIPFLNVIENIKFLSKKRKDQFNERLDNVLKSVNIFARKDSYPYQLSGGEKQRLSIAMALFLNNKIWLCDEPTGTLDSENKIQIMNLLKQIISDDPSKVLIIVTHDSLFQTIADELLILEDGLIKLIIKKEDMEKFRQDSLIYDALDKKLESTIKKENILKRLEEIKKELN